MKSLFYVCMSVLCRLRLFAHFMPNICVCVWYMSISIVLWDSEVSCKHEAETKADLSEATIWSERCRRRREQLIVCIWQGHICRYGPWTVTFTAKTAQLSAEWWDVVHRDKQVGAWTGGRTVGSTSRAVRDAPLCAIFYIVYSARAVCEAVASWLWCTDVTLSGSFCVIGRPHTTLGR